MANPYAPFKSEENMLKHIAALNASYKKSQFGKSNTNMRKAIAASRHHVDKIQEEKDIASGLLISKNLVLIDTNGDGNCFYYALQGYGHIKNIYNLSVDSGIMRKNLAKFIREIRNSARNPGSKPKSFANVIISQILSPETTQSLKIKYKNPPDLIDAYRTEIQIDKQWASDTDITILAMGLDKCIITHIVNNGMLSEPLEHNTASKRCDDPIHLSWTFGNHYSLLMPHDDTDYIALRDFALKEKIQIKLPLVPRLIEFLREYHLTKSRTKLQPIVPSTSAAKTSTIHSSYANDMAATAAAANKNINSIMLNKSAASSSYVGSDPRQFGIPGAVNLSVLPRFPIYFPAQSVSLPAVRPVKQQTVQMAATHQSSQEKGNDPFIFDPQWYEKIKQQWRLGGNRKTRKRKILNKRHNKNKSRRRL